MEITSLIKSHISQSEHIPVQGLQQVNVTLIPRFQATADLVSHFQLKQGVPKYDSS